MIEFNEKQQLILETAREFNASEAGKFVEEMDHENKLPEALSDRLAQYGLLGMKFPEEYGGGEVDSLAAALAIEELARVSPAISDFVLALHASTGVLLSYGSDALKERLLPPVAEGKLIMAYGLTEPDAGSDLAGIRTTAEKKGDHYVLKGSKTYITLGAASDCAVVLAITNPEAEKRHHGMSLVLAEGYAKGKREDLMGLRGLSVGELSFNNIEVPLKNLVGVENEGFIQIMKSLDSGRIEVAALSVGLAQGALDCAVSYAKERKQFGKPIAAFQGVQFMIADMQTRIEAARRLTYYAAVLRDAGKPHSREASEAKLFASEIAMQCASDAVQIHGGYGYSKEYTVERLFRDAKINQIFEGTNEIQRIVIAKNLLA